MQVFKDIEFEDVIDHEGQMLCDYQCNRCSFVNAGILHREESQKTPLNRATLRNVELINCKAINAYLDGAIIEDVEVVDLKRGRSPIFLRANAYKHVVFSGKTASLEIRGKLGVFDSSFDLIWDKANAEYYETVDWALDISEARYASLSISGIPSRLIRRCEETTAVVTREKALEGAWRKLAYNSGLFSIVINRLVDEGYNDVLLVACPESSRFADQMEDLEMLRNEGIAS
ncbi:MAG: hypothetical protein AAGD11_16020 [Planctomycetota bacterium]